MLTFQNKTFFILLNVKIEVDSEIEYDWRVKWEAEKSSLWS